MTRYICIHGHFYQPPRENAWLEEVELQDSAHPYHDWNERITAECYAANATSRILNDQDNIVDIVNNYASISYNFGPTLLAWMEKHAPAVYQLIIAADETSRKKFGGHGSAMAQAYNHMIMPLASPRDKETQILWGIEDFRHRFGRRPEGMWLPETAVDNETLDIMAQNGIRFAILAPHQAHRIKKPDADEWEDVSGGHIDPTVAYAVSLPSGQPFSLFFYDGAISSAVAFEKLLYKGEMFADRLMSGFSEERDAPQMLHIATDGESYGHHHSHGDMALAYALHTIESENLAQITNYGQFLENHPPEYEVEIFENSSWSCSHGVGRWKEDCGCHTGGHPDWHQAWRKPLREALDWLRDTIAPLYEKQLEKYFTDPWQTRNAYIEVLIKRNGNPQAVESFLEKHATVSLGSEEKILCLKLLELQRQAMLMYTSCGWFFDELSGIETVQIIQYAGRVIQLSTDLFEKEFEADFLDLLEKAPSNIPEHKNGRRIYEKFVKPAIVDLKTVCAHYAVSSLFKEETGSETIYCYDVEQEAYKHESVGNASLAVGQALVRSATTRESDRFCFGILHWGDHNISGSVQKCGKDEFASLESDNLFQTFSQAAFPETLKILEEKLGTVAYSLRTLFRDQQRDITQKILSTTMENIIGIYRQIYEANLPLLRFLKDANMPAPQALLASAEYVANVDLQHMLEKDDFDPEKIRQVIEEAEMAGVSIDAPAVEMSIRRCLENKSTAFHDTPSDIDLLEHLNDLLTVLSYFPFEINLRKVQNIIYDVLVNVYPEKQKAAAADTAEQHWMEIFESVCGKLKLEV